MLSAWPTETLQTCSAHHDSDRAITRTWRCRVIASLECGRQENPSRSRGQQALSRAMTAQSSPGQEFGLSWPFKPWYPRGAFRGGARCLRCCRICRSAADARNRRSRRSWCGVESDPTHDPSAGDESHVAGILFGMGGAFSLARLLESLLFGVAPHDPIVFATVPAVLCAVALAAVWLPARRASRVNPVTARYVWNERPRRPASLR